MIYHPTLQVPGKRWYFRHLYLYDFYKKGVKMLLQVSNYQRTGLRGRSGDMSYQSNPKEINVEICDLDDLLAVYLSSF